MAKKIEHEPVPFDKGALDRLKGAAVAAGIKPIPPEALKKGAIRTSKPAGFKVNAEQAHTAMHVLEAYVAERVAFATVKENLENTVAAVKIMSLFDLLKDEVAGRLKNPLEAAYNIMRFAVVPTFMDEEEITQISVDDVGRVNLRDDVSVKVQDKEALFQWLKDNDAEDMIVEQVNAQTLAAFVRKRLEEAKSLPVDVRDKAGNVTEEGAIEVTPVVRAQITRSK